LNEGSKKYRRRQVCGIFYLVAFCQRLLRETRRETTPEAVVDHCLYNVVFKGDY
jgi:hypothetical protein